MNVSLTATDGCNLIQINITHTDQHSPNNLDFLSQIFLPVLLNKRYIQSLMISKELFAKIRKLEIRTKGLVNDMFSGEYHSAFKGSGMVFSEVRPYMYGDDIRAIDWNVSARYDEPYIKIFEEEREQTLMLCVDISKSGFFGSDSQTKMDLVTEICSILAFAAIKNNDKVGIILFSDRIEKVIPPRKGRSHVLRLIRDMLATKPTGTGTDINNALAYANRLLSRKSILVLASDFRNTDYSKQLKITNKKHDLVTIIINDPLEEDLPELGIIPFNDAETGETVLIDTSSSELREAFQKQSQERKKQLSDFFRKNKIDTISVYTNSSYIEPIIDFFHRRMARR